MDVDVTVRQSSISSPSLVPEAASLKSRGSLGTGPINSGARDKSTCQPDYKSTTEQKQVRQLK